MSRVLRLRSVVGLGAMFALLLVVAGAPAEGLRRVPWRFEWNPEPGTESCPDEASLRRAIAERLGYDPFWASAECSIAGKLTRKGRGYAVTLRFAEESGHETVKRLESGLPDCSVIAAAVAFTTAIAIEEKARGGALAGGEAEDAGRPEVASEIASTDAASPRPKRARPARADAGAATTASKRSEHPAAVAGAVALGVGILPRPAVGAEVRGMARMSKRISVSAGLAHFPEVRADDRFAIGAAVGRLGMCVDRSWRTGSAIFACAHAHVGNTFTIVRTVEPLRPDSRVFAGASLGAMFVQRLSPFVLLVGADLFVPLPRLAFDVAGTNERVFTFAPVGLLASAGFGVGDL